MATPRNPLETFIWGSGGRAMTPEQVAREREIAAALTDQGADFSPVGHWLQGAARLGHSAAGAFRNWRADEAESAGRGALSDRWSSVFGGGASPVAEALSGGLASSALDAANAVAAMPTGDMADRIRAGLMERGLPEHVANAFILNMQDESGLNPGINEAAPIVPGSRGGYGLYQLTGPRRRDYEAFAAERGVAPDDVDAQLDWLMHELSGPEARAAQSILSAQDTPTAAAAIVNEFLRPAEEHRVRRANAYMAGSGSMPNAQPVQVAQAGGSPSIAELLSLSGDPNFGYASPAQQQIVQALMGQQLQQQDPAYQQQLAMRDLQMEQLRQQMGAPNLMNVGGQLYNPDTQEWIAPPAGPASPIYEIINGELVWIDPSQQTAVSGGQFGAPDSAAEAKIGRLMELGYTRDQAIQMSDQFVLGQDENQRSVLFNIATGKPAQPILLPGQVLPDISSASALDPLPGSTEFPPVGTEAPNYSTLPEGTDIGAALGVGGTLAGGINSVVDYLFGTAPIEGQQQASNALQNLRLQTNQALLEGFAGRQNVYTQEMIDDLAVTPGMPPNAARDRFAQTRTLMAQQIARIENEVLANPSAWTPQDVREARASVASLRALRDTYDAVLQSIQDRQDSQNVERPPLETFMRQ